MTAIHHSGGSVVIHVHCSSYLQLINKTRIVLVWPDAPDQTSRFNECCLTSWYGRVLSSDHDLGTLEWSWTGEWALDMYSDPLKVFAHPSSSCVESNKHCSCREYQCPTCREVDRASSWSLGEEMLINESTLKLILHFNWLFWRPKAHPKGLAGLALLLYVWTLSIHFFSILWQEL